MHSTEELNKKVWYRLLKVLYFLALLVVVGITLIICWSDASYTPFNSSLNINNLPPGSYTPVGPTSYPDGQAPWQTGSATPNINQLNPSDYTVNNDVGFVPNAPAPVSASSFFGSGGVYTSPPTTKAPNVFYQFFSEAIPALVIELLLFELARRLFYYVILGSWRPKK